MRNRKKDIQRADSKMFYEYPFFGLSVIKIKNTVKTCAHIGKEGICDSDGGHSLHNNDSSWNNNRVVTPVDHHVKFFAVFCDSMLGLADGRSGFYMGTEMISLPSLMPPMIPPAWLEVLHTFPSFMQKPSLSVEPFREVT